MSEADYAHCECSQKPPLPNRIVRNAHNLYIVRRDHAPGSNEHARVIADCAQALVDAREDQTMDDALREIERAAEDGLRSALRGWSTGSWWR